MENLTAEITPTVSAPPTLPRDTISYRKFLEWNGEEGWFEWVDGEVIKMSNPSLKHQQLSRFLAAILQFWVEAKKIGEVIPSPFQIKFDFRPSGRQPDIMFISNENLHLIEKQYVDGKADLIIEILSPESIEWDTQIKFREYEMAGIKEYWTIDPNTRTAIFYGFDETGKYKMLTISADGIFESRVIENLWIDTNWLWQENLPPLMDILKEWKII